MGLLIDSSVYQLDTPEGQQQAIQNIINALNDQFEASQQFINWQIVAYKHLSITTVADLVAKTYQQSFRHGLNYVPMVFVIIDNRGTGAELAAPPINDSFNASVGQETFSQYVTMDTANVYLNVQSNGSTGITLGFNFYVLSLPAQLV